MLNGIDYPIGGMTTKADFQGGSRRKQIESKPLISIVVMAYNRKQFLQRALQSIVAQTVKKTELEVIIVKNFQTDYEDTLLAGLKLKKLWCDNPSIGYKYVEAVKQASGQIIAFLEDDDEWEPHKLAHVIEVFRLGNDVAFYHNSFVGVDELGVRKESKAFSAWKRPHPNESLSIEADRLSRSKLGQLVRAGGLFNTSCMSVKRTAILPYLQYLSRIQVAPDVFLFFTSLTRGRGVVDGAPLTKYTFHTSRLVSAEAYFASLNEASLSAEHDYKVVSQMVRGSKLASLVTCLQRERCVMVAFSDSQKSRILLLKRLLPYLASVGNLPTMNNLKRLFLFVVFLVSPTEARLLLFKQMSEILI